ncbi:ABC transporter substrate-binding protein [Desulfonatronum thiosulfatophilum]|uniref:ABC transporter substrate-binding protein n=1 Tax=Desulfonatronum thiosulfatophilum TaxID=617002 RepID=UPI001379E7DE|nr:ABC transporter substrate-binding protein [Desulfonatronum thiosulfatophilum]
MKRILLLAVCLVLFFPSNQARAEPSGQKTLVIGRSADSVTLDPALAPDRESSKVVAHIFETLVRAEDEGSRIEPGLALRWESSPDRTEWFFHLRPGVFFHDQTPFNAQAVIFSLARQIDPSHPHHLSHSILEAGIRDNIRSVDEIDELTVRIVLESPRGNFLSSLSSTKASIVSPTAVRQTGAAFARNPVGTGPFKFLQWQPDGTIILASHEDYWDGRANLDRIVYRTIPDNLERHLAFQGGHIHVLDGVLPGDVPRLLRLPRTRILAHPGMNVAFMAMNVNKPPLDRVEVRRAVNHAVNKADLVKYLYQGFADPAGTLLPPTMFGHHAQISDYAYDPQRARRLLAEVGLPDGFRTTLWVMSSARPYLPQPVEAARLIRAGLAEVGIEAEIKILDWSSYLESIVTGQHDICLLGWNAQTADPYHLLETNLGPLNTQPGRATNITFWRSDRMGALLDKFRHDMELPEQEALLHAIQEFVMEQAPLVPLAHAQTILAVRDDVSGLVLQPNNLLRLHRADLD